MEIKEIKKKLSKMSFKQMVKWERELLRKTEDGSLSPEDRMKASETHSIIGSCWIDVIMNK